MKPFRAVMADRSRLFLLMIPILMLCLTASKCDQDGDGFSPPQDCDDNDRQTYPGAPELADIKDNNCNGFADEPPVGFNRVTSSGQGAASAVEWYGDYIYLAAAAVLQVYYGPPGTEPQLIREIELPDWIREMAVDGDTLFVAARGAGLLAYDLADPADPQPAGAVTGLFDAQGHQDIEAVFFGLDAQANKVAVAHNNPVMKGSGGIDALVFQYDPAADSFTVQNVLLAQDVRESTNLEMPITVALTDDAQGLYIGLGYIGFALNLPPTAAYGELAFVDLIDPQAPAMNLTEIGAPMDLDTVGDTVFAALTRFKAGQQCSMLSRVQVGGQGLEETVMLSNMGQSAGGAIDIAGDALAFGLQIIGRYEGKNLWVFTDLLAASPTEVGSGASLDWVYQVAYRPGASDELLVADEWGGLQVWDVTGNDLERTSRIPTGTQCLGMWANGDRVYSAKEGAGLWFFDDSEPENAQIGVEWLDLSAPGCSCSGCSCPLDDGPDPPAVFVSNGANVTGGVALATGNRKDMIGIYEKYLMIFKETGDAYKLRYSEYIDEPLYPVDVDARGELLFVSESRAGLHVYQFCSGESIEMRHLASDVPGNNNMILKVAPFGDYLFVAETDWTMTQGAIRVYRYKDDAPAACPRQPAIDLVYIGSFATDGLLRFVLADEGHQVLAAGRKGDLLLFDLPAPDSDITSDTLSTIDASRRTVSPGARARVEQPDVRGLAFHGDALYFADPKNGLYKLSLTTEALVGFYPAHFGSWNGPRLLQSAPGVMPIYTPNSVAIMPSGKVVVQEEAPGRVVVLSE